MMLVSVGALWLIFKINLFSTGWNIVAGLVISAVLFILLGFIPSGS